MTMSPPLHLSREGLEREDAGEGGEVPVSRTNVGKWMMLGPSWERCGVGNDVVVSVTTLR